ncbi:MAG: hypothetical protein AAFY10_02010 [Pseudomonadota bacterium]
MGNGNRVEMFIAVCAVVSSLIAIFIAWDQGRVMRAQQHGAVYPVLQIDGYTATSPDMRSFGIRLSNSGVGPALIEEVRLQIAEGGAERVEQSFRDLPAGADLSWAALTGRAVAPGDEIEPLRISWYGDAVSPEAFRTAALDWGQYEVIVCYCSVFSRCWQTRGLGTSRADPVETCPQGDSDIFESLGILSQTAAPQIDPESE